MSTRVYCLCVACDGRQKQQQILPTNPTTQNLQRADIKNMKNRSGIVWKTVIEDCSYFFLLLFYFIFILVSFDGAIVRIYYFIMWFYSDEKTASNDVVFAFFPFHLAFKTMDESEIFVYISLGFSSR